MRPIRLLTFSTLFPNAEQPNHGVFVENRLRQIVASGAVESTVVAPVPFFPGVSDVAGAFPAIARWAAHARVPTRESRHGLTVHHPRYPVIPAIGMSVAPYLLYAACAPFLRRLLAEDLGFDAIDAHYVYPDGVAAVWLGRRFGLPTVITARGTDINLIPRYPWPRRLIRGAMAGAAGIIAVSAALKAAMVDLGVPPERVQVLRNGVDTEVFRPTDREAFRRALGLMRPTLISVGHLVPRKGHHIVIEAMTRLPGVELLIVGEGSERSALTVLIERLGLSDRVRLLGAQPHAEMPRFYSAADVLVLASSREGWANVLLEAMACGTPVVASGAWGNPEVVQRPEAGLIADENTPDGIADSVRQLLAHKPGRAATRSYAEDFGWDATTQGQIALFKGVIVAGCAMRAGRPPIDRSPTIETAMGPS